MKNQLLPILALVSLSACATPRMDDATRLSLYQANSGEPVKQLRYYNALGWDRIDDQHVVLNTKPSESWLLTVNGACLAWGTGSPVLKLETTMPGVLTLYDRITTGGTPVTCQVREIRQVDVKALRAAQEAARAKAHSSGT